MNVDEVLAKMDMLDTNEEEIQYIIDENLRVISIPPLGVVLGVEGDKDVNSAKFKMVRYYKGIDLSKFEIRINFANANGDLSYYTVKNPTVTDDTLTFEWLVGYLVTKYKGTVQFVVRMITTDASTGEVQQAFDTTVGEARSLEGLLVDTPTDEKVYDIVAQLKADLTDHVNNLLETIPAEYSELTKKVEDNTLGVSGLKEDLTNYDKSINNYNLLDDAQFFNGKQFIDTGGYFWDNDHWDSYKITNNLTNKIVAKKDNKSIFHMIVGYFNGGNYISGKSYLSNTDKYELNLPEGCNIICVSFNVHDDDLEGLMFNCVTDIGEAVKENSKNIDELRNRTSNILTTNKLILDDEFYELPKIEDYENKYAYTLSDGKPEWKPYADLRTCSIDGNINIKAYFTNAVDNVNTAIYLVIVTKCENEVYSTKTFNVNDLFLYNTSKKGTVYGISYEIDVEKRAIQFTGNTNNVTLSITMKNNSGYVEYIKRYRPKWLISKPNEIYVCANDSTDEEKEYADYLCDGVNDEVEIMNAIKKLNPYGVVVLSSGTFNIQSFVRYREKDVKCAIFSDKVITIQGSGRTRTKLLVGNDTLSALTEKVAIVSGYDTCINLNDLSFELSNHNHPCICYYGANLTRGNITNVLAQASANDNTATIDIPNENCIAFVSYHGDDSGTITIWESVIAVGFYRAFQLGAEHHILKQCSGRYNYCTFTFGEYEVKLGNAFSHPITLINCADEHQCLLPQFYKCGAMVNDDTEGHPLQEVDFISFNIERWNDWSEHQMCAKEINAGDFCGRIEYTMNGVTPSQYEEWTATKNLKYAKFWEKGSGVNFVTRNMTHRLGGTTELRNTYYPNYMQEYYDTDLKKKLIYDGINWVDLNGTVTN